MDNIALKYYEIFHHMQSEHGLLLVESQIEEIIRLVVNNPEVKQRLAEAKNA